MVSVSTQSLALARADKGSHSTSPEFRQIEEDILILNGLGSYYVNLFRAALFYCIYELSADPFAARRSLDAYRKGRDAWSRMAEGAAKIYATDISYGDVSVRRGNWTDRLPAIDQDLAVLEKHFADRLSQTLHRTSAQTAIQNATKAPPRPALAVEHKAPTTFHSGSDLQLIFTAPAAAASTLWYRHVNHGERWISTPMQKTGNTYSGVVPASYTNSSYPMQYYFELHTKDAATLHPPFNPTLSNQPYYSVMPES
jgi:hypothetical protein